LEPADTLILSSPEKIIEDGGTVFFARVCGRIIGTCALIKIDEQTFELAKMAVADEYQGLGAGRMLLEACITKAKSKAAKFVILETNTKLESAVRLYKKAGFKPLQKNEAAPSKYARVNLVMKLEL
ncbi:MAG: GNAT family N-acetyltransferase, partial [Candidatus Obscuribacterales bacterium]|nr:GNAT family N-acetyltransferase [Candidatus Obscuribacterales bacterium]